METIGIAFIWKLNGQNYPSLAAMVVVEREVGQLIWDGGSSYCRALHYRGSQYLMQVENAEMRIFENYAKPSSDWPQ